MNGTLIGVDLGGTNIRAAAVTGLVSFSEPVSHRTPADDGPDAVFDAVAAAAREAAGDNSIGALAIGIPGPLNPETGVVFDAPHLKGFVNVNAGEMLAQRLGCQVAIHNDASLAGYAEWLSGAGRGARHMVFMTVSTGIGGALVVNGELISGAAGTAGEMGHLPLAANGPRCGSGHLGCLEGFASGTAIARRAAEAVAAGEATVLSRVESETLDAVAVERAARAGDTLAVSLYSDAGRALGRTVGGLINLLAPEVVVIGGGLINAGDLLFGPLRAAVGEIAFAVPAAGCRIVLAGLGTDAGLVGAVAWASHRFGAVEAAAG